jgi:cytidylate kinase
MALMSQEPLIITLDGPAGSGKSSVARTLAARLGLDFLDTGAMYRGLTARSLDEGVDPEELAGRATLVFDWSSDPPRLLVDQVDVTDRLRDEDVNNQVSQLAAMGSVRGVLVKLQQQIGIEHPRLVTEGRDQGSVVFPDAQVKFYLEASPSVRARRRAEQIRQTGRDADEQQILQDITDRDHRDSTRQDGPLICPPDAVRVDTSDMTLEQVVDHLESLLRKRAGCAVS